MLTNLRWRLLAFSRRIWVRAALYSLLGVAAALLSSALGRFVPGSLATRLVVEDPTGQGILASFLGVFICSLVGIMSLQSRARTSAR